MVPREVTHAHLGPIFGIIQKLQMFTIPPTNFFVGTFFAISYSKTALVITYLFVDIFTLNAGQPRQPRTGPCLDFGFYYAIIRNNWTKKLE